MDIYSTAIQSGWPNKGFWSVGRRCQLDYDRQLLEWCGEMFPETIEEIERSKEKLKEVQEVSARHLSHLGWNFRRVGIEYVVLDSPSINDCYQVLSGFFESRKRTRV